MLPGLTSRCTRPCSWPLRARRRPAHRSRPSLGRQRPLPFEEASEVLTVHVAHRDPQLADGFAGSIARDDIRCSSEAAALDSRMKRSRKPGPSQGHVRGASERPRVRESPSLRDRPRPFPHERAATRSGIRRSPCLYARPCSSREGVVALKGYRCHRLIWSRSQPCSLDA